MTKEQFQKHCEMQAAWWNAYATTGACKAMKIFHGCNGPEFTDQEKVIHALDIAQNHIKNYWNSCNGIEN